MAVRREAGSQAETRERDALEAAEAELAGSEAAEAAAWSRVETLRAQLPEAEAAHATAVEQVEDAREAVDAAAVPFLSPEELRLHEQRQRQQREQIVWAARQSGRERMLPKRMWPAIEAERERRRRQAEDDHERFIAAARAAGTLVEPLNHIQRLR